jgi:hypothetical protein
MSRVDADENYVIDICDQILNLKAHRQHTFDFLKGDPNKLGRCKRLPVDAYYPKLNLVIEYHERQHSETVTLFDKKMTISGITRDQQRRVYDQRRREILPQQSIQLIILSYSDFDHSSNKRIRRNAEDQARVRNKLLQYLKEIPDAD